MERVGMAWTNGDLAGRKMIAAGRPTLQRARPWIYWAVGFLLLGQLQALSVVDRVLYGEWMGKSGDKFTQVLSILQITTSIVLFCYGFTRWRTVRTSGSLTLVLTVFLLLSAIWSVSPGATLRAGVQYLFFIVGAIGIVENLEGDDFMDLLAQVCFLAAIASLVLLIVFPATAFGEAGDFRGVFSQKNPLGEAMAMGALACLHGLRRRKRAIPVLKLLVIILVTLKSGSTTSLMTIALFVVLGPALVALQEKKNAPFVLGVLFVAAPLALIAVFNQDALLAMLGKDPTLTGRTDIWAYAIADIAQRPLLGWGYAAFWTTDNPAAWAISDALHWWVPQAHNGVLEILLSVGLIGAVFYTVLLARVFRLSVKCMRTPQSAMGITCLLSCAGAVMVGVSENVLLYTGAVTCIFFITGFYCEKAVSQARSQRPSLATLAR